MSVWDDKLDSHDMKLKRKCMRDIKRHSFHDNWVDTCNDFEKEVAEAKSVCESKVLQAYLDLTD